MRKVLEYISQNKEGESIQTHSVSLTEGTVVRSLVRFSIPILLSNLLQQLYNSIDSAVLGKFAGAGALAAVGSTGALCNLLIGFFLGVATGTNVLYAMHFGAGDSRGLKKLIDSAMVISLLISVFITVFGIVFSEKLLIRMNTPAELIAPSKEYLVIFLSGTVANMVYNTGAGIIRAEGDSVRPLIYLAIGGAGNLIADILFVAFFHWGVAGAAWATVISQTVTAVLVVHRMTAFNSDYAFRPLHMRPDRLAMWDIIRISVPCGLQNAMYNISNLLVQIKINAFGTKAMAGVTAYGKIDAFIYMPMNALSLAVSTFIGQNIGAGKYSRMKKGIMACVWMGIGISAILCLGTFFGYDYFVRLFTDDTEAIAYGRQMMLFIVPVVWFYSLTDTYGGAIRGSGQTVPVTVILAVCICAFRILWLQTMLHFINDIRIVYACYPLSWILCSVVTMLYFYRKSTVWRTIRNLEKEAAAESANS